MRHDIFTGGRNANWRVWKWHFVERWWIIHWFNLRKENGGMIQEGFNTICSLLRRLHLNQFLMTCTQLCMWSSVGRESQMNKLEGLHWMVLKFFKWTGGKWEDYHVGGCLCLPLMLPGFLVVENSTKRTLIVRALICCDRWLWTVA